MKIYLIRHGQTTGDLEDRYGGDYDDHLSDFGKVQSQELAEKLVDKDIEIVFTSPRFRAKETAQILANVLERQLVEIPDLRERNAYGILSGMKRKEAFAKYPGEVEALKDYKRTITGAEAYEDFKKRVLAALEDIVSQNYTTVAIVTHGGPIACFFREMLSQEIYGLKDCGYVVLEKDGEYVAISTDGLMLVEQ